MKRTKLVLTRTKAHTGIKISKALRRKTPVFPITEAEGASAYRCESKSSDLDSFNGTIESATVQNFDELAYSDRTFHVRFDDDTEAKFKTLTRNSGLLRGRIVRNDFDPMVEYRQGLIGNWVNRGSSMSASVCLPVGTIVSERADFHATMRETIAILPLGIVVDWVEIEQPDKTLEWCPMVYWIDRRVYGIHNPMYIAHETDIIKYQTQVLAEIQKKVASAERKRESMNIPVPGSRRAARITRSGKLSPEDVARDKRLRKKLEKEFPPAKKPAVMRKRLVKSKMEL